MKEIPLTRGLVAMVDDADYEYLSRVKWQAAPRWGIWYARRTIALAADDPRRKGKRRQTSIAMHRVILSAPPDKDVDHINGNGLDNRRINLRIVDDSVNTQNRHRRPPNSSGYLGVTWNKASSKWQAGIKRHGKSYHLGLHSVREDAARAYDAAALRLYGPCARVNFPPERTEDSNEKG